MTAYEMQLAHATALIRGRPGDWGGGYSIIPIDSVCRFGPIYHPRDTADPLLPRCNKPLRQVVALLGADARTVHIIALCDHHADVMKEAIEEWRKKA